MAKLSCSYLKEDGGKCLSWGMLEIAPDGRHYCWFHHPEYEDHRREARLKGGSRGKYSRVIEIDPEADTAELVAYCRSFIMDLQGRGASKKDDRLMLAAIGELRQCLQFWYEYSDAAQVVREVAEREGIK